MKWSACILEECQGSELRRRRITAQSPRFSRWMQKDNEFRCNPSLGLSCAFGVKKELIVEGRIKLKHLNLCIGKNITQLRIKWTFDILTKYHSKIFIKWIWSCLKNLRIGIRIVLRSNAYFDAIIALKIWNRWAMIKLVKIYPCAYLIIYLFLDSLVIL